MTPPPDTPSRGPHPADPPAHSADFLPEEPWEADVAALLGGLPAVTPPDGFIDRAIDHRPLYAGRTAAVLTGATFAVVVILGAVGALARSSIVPEIGDLTDQHLTAQAVLTQSGTIGSDDPADAPPTKDGFRVTEEIAEPVEVGPDLDPRVSYVTDDQLTQVLYALEGEAVSIFSQPGTVDFDALPAGERTEIDGVPAWRSLEGDVIVLETADSAVTIVGLTAHEVEAVIADIPRASLLDRIASMANAMTSQLGFPDLG